MGAGRRTKLRIILPGGGVKGAFQLGVLQEILGSGWFEVDAVYGCSVGAILAPLVAAENVPKMTSIFDGIKTLDDVVERRTWCGIPYPDWTVVQGLASFLWMGAYASVKLVDVMLDALTPEERALAQARCHVVAYDVERNAERWFTGAELATGVRCSSALWLAVPPIAYDGSTYSDGGATAVFPVDYILEHGVREPFDGLTLFVDCDARTPYTNPAPADGLTLMSDLQWAAATRLAAFELARLQAELPVPAVIIRPDANLLTSAFDIDPARMKATFNAGVAKGKAFVATP